MISWATYLVKAAALMSLDQVAESPHTCTLNSVYPPSTCTLSSLQSMCLSQDSHITGSLTGAGHGPNET